MPRSYATHLSIDNKVLETELMLSYEAAPADPLDELIQEIEIPDGKGKEVEVPVMGGQMKFVEEYDHWKPQDAFGLYSYTIAPVAFHAGFELHRDDIADDRIGSLRQQIGRFGYTARSAFAERLVSNIIEGSTTTWTGKAFFATDHGWDTTGGSSAATSTSNHSNLLTGSGVASVNAIQEDLYAAIAARAAYTDDKGVLLSTGGERIVVVGPSRNGALVRKLRLAFDNTQTVLPGDDTNRDTAGLVDKLILSPYLSNNDDWYVAFVGGTGSLPLQRWIRKRPEVESDYIMAQTVEQYKARMRFEVFGADPFCFLKVNN